MLIAHVSLPADNTEFVARVLADILEGEALPFPPGGEGAWMAWSKDEAIEFEIVRRGAVLTYCPEEAEFVPGAVTHRLNECHAAIVVDRKPEEVVMIAQKAGWQTRICNRGGFFHVVEVWVENAFLIEVLDPQFAAEYRASMTKANWKKIFALEPA